MAQVGSGLAPLKQVSVVDRGRSGTVHAVKTHTHAQTHTQREREREKEGRRERPARRTDAPSESLLTASLAMPPQAE